MGIGKYRELEIVFADYCELVSAMSYLRWDALLHVPRDGFRVRSRLLVSLDRTATSLLSRQEILDKLGSVEEGSLSHWQVQNLREMRRLRRHATSCSPELREEVQRRSVTTRALWQEARSEGSFRIVAGAFAELTERVKELAVERAEVLGLSAYDAMLEQHSPGLRQLQCAKLFSEILPSIKAAVDARADQASKGGTANNTGLRTAISKGLQFKIARDLLAILGFDLDTGRLDWSSHPTCRGKQLDVRITTEYRHDDFTWSYRGALHECGHALYEQGINPTSVGQPIGMTRGDVIGESQAILLEMMLGRSTSFLSDVAVLISERLEATPASVIHGELEKRLRVIRPGPLRCNADELTYLLHIIMRHQLECEVFEGRLSTSDLPDAWNEASRELLEVVPQNDAEGILQDPHWFSGMWGYFPCYGVGAVAAAQFYEASRSATGNAEPGLNCAEMLSWLKENIHQWASYYPVDDLVQRATGRVLDSSFLLAHLNRRYGGDWQ